MKEEWKAINDFENVYEASTYGMIKSLSREVRRMTTNRYGHRFEMKYFTKDKIMKLTPDKDGYLMVRLYKNGSPYTFKVHRLIGETFILNPENKPNINHLNSIRDDNNVENLEWATPKEDRQHAMKYGNFKPENNKGMKGKFGKNHNRSKPVLQFTKDDVFVAEYESAAEAGRTIGTGYNNIATMCRGNDSVKSVKGFKFKWK